MNDQPADPQLEDLLNLINQCQRSGLWTMLPGEIVDYNAGSQSASVQPLIMTRQPQEDDTVNVMSAPIVHNVPVMMMGPGRGRITFPIAAGDTCALWFASRSIARWVTNGGQVDPGDDRTHDLSDAICIVGLHNFAQVPTDAPTNAVVFNLGSGITAKIGSSGASNNLLTTSDSTAWMTALALVITNASPSGSDPNPTVVAALTPLKAALQAISWATGTSKAQADL
jgi:hypothetical protein